MEKARPWWGRIEEDLKSHPIHEFCGALVLFSFEFQCNVRPS